MKTTIVKILLITLFAFGFRLALLPLAQNPGLHDAAHYYNLGRRLAAGDGFTIDYVWHYARMPVELPHDIDHWMPLPGLMAAFGMIAGGVNVHAALTLFVLAGSLLPILVFLATKQLGQSMSCALTAAAFAAVLPEFVLNSLRADTMILNMILVLAALLSFNEALRSGRRPWIALCGMLFGLAYLTRNDSLSLFLLFAAYLLLDGVIGSKRARRSDVLLLALAYLITISPWLFRNLQVMGNLGSPLMSMMPFMVEPRDHYTYGIPINLQSMLERQNLAELIGKRVFELGAALKQIASSLQLPLALFAPIGVFALFARENRRLLSFCAPVLIWVAGILIIYPFLLPVLNQSGSFKKAFLTIAPLLLPIGAIALDRLIQRREWRYAIVFLSLCWLTWSSYDLVRRETEKADTYYASVQVLADRLEELPDRTGDGELRLMSQDPYVLSVFGYSSVVTPLASREDTLALARQFGIDYLQMPAARPALDPLYLGLEKDPRFELAAHIAEAGEATWQLYGFLHDSQESS